MTGREKAEAVEGALLDTDFQSHRLRCEPCNRQHEPTFCAPGYDILCRTSSKDFYVNDPVGRAEVHIVPWAPRIK